MYSPSLGRFLEEDTYLGDGRNLYTYVGNNPIRYVDPSGYCRIKIKPIFSESQNHIYGSIYVMIDFIGVGRDIKTTIENAIIEVIPVDTLEMAADVLDFVAAYKEIKAEFERKAAEVLKYAAVAAGLWTMGTALFAAPTMVVPGVGVVTEAGTVAVGTTVTLIMEGAALLTEAQSSNDKAASEKNIENTDIKQMVDVFLQSIAPREQMHEVFLMMQ